MKSAGIHSRRPDRLGMTVSKPLLDALQGTAGRTPPLWLMRQAGRYLPEYRAVRAEAKDFLSLCFTPDLAVEVTLQPVRRFGFDAAILFSDILVVPHGLGQCVWFEENVGPRLEPVRSVKDLAVLSGAGLVDRLAPVFETLRLLRTALPPETALIGFAGAPWTVASYMIEGGSSRDFTEIKAWAYGDPDGFQALIDLLTEATGDYLIAQVEAGAEVLQLFDTWAGLLPAEQLRRWCLEPAAKIVGRLKRHRADLPVILFPRGAGLLYQAFAEIGGVTALSLDSTVPLDWARDTLQRQVVPQGNLDPMMLVVGGRAQRDATSRILDSLATGPFVFNLGHGILPQTPPDHVAALVEQVRGWRG